MNDVTAQRYVRHVRFKIFVGLSTPSHASCTAAPGGEATMSCYYTTEPPVGAATKPTHHRHFLYLRVLGIQVAFRNPWGFGLARVSTGVRVVIGGLPGALLARVLRLVPSAFPEYFPAVSA